MKKLFYASLVISIAIIAPASAAPAAPQDHTGHVRGHTARAPKSSARRGAKRATKAQRKTRVAPEAASYSCPMHEDVRSATPGECSKCGMELERSGEKKPDGDEAGASSRP